MEVTLKIYNKPWCDCDAMAWYIDGIINSEPCPCSLKEWLINGERTFMDKKTKRRQIKQNIPIYNVEILK